MFIMACWGEIQCWKCYGKVIQEKYGGKYFSGSFPYNQSAKNNQRAKKTIDFFRSIKHEGCFDNEKSILIQLSFAYYSRWLSCIVWKRKDI